MSRTLYLQFVFPKRKKKFHIQPGCITQELERYWVPFVAKGTSSDHQKDLSKKKKERKKRKRPEQTGNLDNTNTPDISIKVNFNSLDY